MLIDFFKSFFRKKTNHLPLVQKQARSSQEAADDALKKFFKKHERKWH